MLLAPGLVPGIPAYSVKVHAKFPGESPAIRGLLILHDLATGHPLAVIESSYLTALRTGLVGALGADVLARPEATTVAVIGAGAQGRSHLESLRMLRKISRVRVFDLVPEASARFIADPVCRGLDASPVTSIEDALAGADIVITATWAQEPFVFRRHLESGMHVTTLGPDQPGKCELSADALAAATVIIDDRDLALKMGAVGNAGLGAEVISAELGEVLAGVKPGRKSARDVTVFGSVGLPFQDLAAGWLAYTRARAAGVGRSLNFLD